jgi:hypothetical protein
MTSRRWLSAAMSWLVGAVVILAAVMQYAGAAIEPDQGEVEVSR